MGFENRIFISAEQFAMSSSSRGGAAARPRGRGGRGGHGGRGAEDGDSHVRFDRSISPLHTHDGGFKHISFNRLPERVKILIIRYNQFGFASQSINVLVQNGSISNAQASTAVRSQVFMVLEIRPRSSFYCVKGMSFMINKLFRQLATLGKTHSFTESDLISLMCQSTLSAKCIEKFVNSFAQILVGLDAETRTFWLFCWICVMTMTDVPYNQAQYEQFLSWYEAVIQDHDSVDVDESLATILEDLQTRVRTATNALPPTKGTREQIEHACQQLCIENPPPDEDGHDEPDNASVGGQSDASSVGSQGHLIFRMTQLEKGSYAIDEMVKLYISQSSLTSAMTPEQFEKLLRALISGIKHRSKGPRSRRAFNRKNSDWMLYNCNKHHKRYVLKPADIAAQIIKATSCPEIGLKWFDHFAAEINNSDALRPALTSALILITLGNHTHITHEGVFDAIMDECFKVDSKKSRLSRHFETIFRSAKTSCDEAVDQALQGSWDVPEHITQQLAAMAERQRLQSRHASASGGSSANSRHPKARAGGGNHSAITAVADEDPVVQDLLRQQQELAAKIAAAKKANQNK